MNVFAQEVTDKYAIYGGDCMEVMRAIPDNKIGLQVCSPPFGGLYMYSSSPQDLSNCVDYDEFFDHYRYVVREQNRISMPGRISAVHVADVPSGNSGGDHLRDFSGDVIRLHEQEGWLWLARFVIWKEPLGVRNRTMRKDLAHKSVVDDSANCTCAGADYLLIFRKRGENPEPIVHPTGLMEYYGENEPPADLLAYRGWKGNQIENRYSHWVWRNYASSVWMDVRIDRVLPFKEARADEDEKHVHPLQLDVIDRALTLYSNPGDKVFTPFMGVGSEPHEAVKLGRFGIGAELKPTYFEQARRNMADVAARQPEQVSLFGAAK